MQGSRDQGIMIQLIVDYLWHDTHDCSMIRELDQTSWCQSDKRRLEHLGHPSYQVDHRLSLVGGIYKAMGELHRLGRGGNLPSGG
jgi:hypothetical protein